MTMKSKMTMATMKITEDDKNNDNINENNNNWDGNDDYNANDDTTTSYDLQHWWWPLLHSLARWLLSLWKRNLYKIFARWLILITRYQSCSALYGVLCLYPGGSQKPHLHIAVTSRLITFWWQWRLGTKRKTLLCFSLMVHVTVHRHNIQKTIREAKRWQQLLLMGSMVKCCTWFFAISKRKMTKIWRCKNGSGPQICHLKLS